MTTWIDGDYEIGHIGFRIDTSNPIRHTGTTLLTQHPAHTNQSGQARLYGWCGSTNDTNTYAMGLAKVVRRANNGRVQIAAVRALAEIAQFLEDVGYPSLLDQLKAFETTEPSAG
jgi:hypothetical protein